MPARKELNMNTFEGRLAKRLLDLRLATGMTQEEAAGKIGVRENTIFSWESARSQPAISKLPLIAEVYGVSSREIIPEKF